MERSNKSVKTNDDKDVHSSSPNSTIATFKVEKRRQDKKNGCLLREPCRLGSYSVKNGPEGRFFEEVAASELRILKLPPKGKRFGLDLTEGYIRLRDGGVNHGLSVDTGLTEFLEWIVRNKHQFQKTSGNQLSTDFVTFRGVLTTIMTTPYEQQEGWLICGSKFRGTVYICPFMSEEKKERETNRDDRFNQFCYGGYRFEEYISEPAVESSIVSSDLQIPQPRDPQYHNEYSCVVRSRLGPTSLVYAAEMDCLSKHLSPGEEPLPKHFVEIKTTRTITNRRQWDYLCQYKMVKWWAQCYLIGIPKVIVGYRDNDMVVRDIQPFSVSELPKICNTYWHTDVCIDFLNRFLQFVQETLKEEDNPKVVYEFSWSPGEDEIKVKKSEDGKRVILQDWFIKEFSN